MSATTKPDGSSAIDLVELTVEQVQVGLADGAFTCENLTKTFLDRIAALNPCYNAILLVNPAVLAEARVIDRRRRRREARTLAAVPIVVKDTMDMKGLPTTGGWSLLYSKTGGVDLFPRPMRLWWRGCERRAPSYSAKQMSP